MQAGIRLKELLIDLEFQMRDGSIWQSEPPSDWAFASELPFFHDRMSFPEWLQFVFIPNLRTLADGEDNWPEDCAVAPMGEYYFGSQGLSVARVVRELEAIDALVSKHVHSEETLKSSQKE